MHHNETEEINYQLSPLASRGISLGGQFVFSSKLFGSLVISPLLYLGILWSLFCSSLHDKGVMNKSAPAKHTAVIGQFKSCHPQNRGKYMYLNRKNVWCVSFPKVCIDIYLLQFIPYLYSPF